MERVTIKRSASLLPLTPDTMISFRQEILVDMSALLQKAVKTQLHEKLPELTQEGRDMSYLTAFEALRMFRHITQDQHAHYSEREKTQLAEVEVDWCLDILGRLQNKAGE
jgi:hypothetical protein